MAEWLRRLTRNQLCSARTGSNPVGSDLFLFLFYYQFMYFSIFLNDFNLTLFLITWVDSTQAIFLS